MRALNFSAKATLEDFKLLIIAACKDGDYQVTIATSAFCRALSPDEMQEALEYASEEGIEMVFVPDSLNFEEDPYDAVTRENVAAFR